VQSTATPSVASFFTDITQSSYFDMLVIHDGRSHSADGLRVRTRRLGTVSLTGQFTITPFVCYNGATITDTRFSLNC